MGVRLALVEADSDSALVFESARAATNRNDPRSFLGSKTSVLPSDPAADVTVREVLLSNTLLASAVGGAGAWVWSGGWKRDVVVWGRDLGV